MADDLALCDIAGAMMIGAYCNIANSFVAGFGNLCSVDGDLGLSLLVELKIYRQTSFGVG
ncbi:hypothetical protein AQ436_10955 [Arthrobacter sp. EpRS66]|nr:hypothetical protein AQ436_10955 [Arthrobacter sp. EpRS66]